MRTFNRSPPEPVGVGIEPIAAKRPFAACVRLTRRKRGFQEKGGDRVKFPLDKAGIRCSIIVQVDTRGSRVMFLLFSAPNCE